MRDIQEYQRQFREMLGSEPQKAIENLARVSGYSTDYLAWAAGLVGRRSWPGSRRFVRRMRELGFDLRPWRDRTPEQIARAFETREVLYSPNGKGQR
jgi:hypothetical protein